VVQKQYKLSIIYSQPNFENNKSQNKKAKLNPYATRNAQILPSLVILVQEGIHLFDYYFGFLYPLASFALQAA
jgi:hypothetical protein